MSRNEKKSIYNLLDLYLDGKIDEIDFCDKFYRLYDLEMDFKQLDESEQKAFSELGEVSGRFSEFEEDHKDYPGVYYTKEDLKNKIIEVKKRLNF